MHLCQLEYITPFYFYKILANSENTEDNFFLSKELLRHDLFASSELLNVLFPFMVH